MDVTPSFIPTIDDTGSEYDFNGSAELIRKGNGEFTMTINFNSEMIEDYLHLETQDKLFKDKAFDSQKLTSFSSL